MSMDLPKVLECLRTNNSEELLDILKSSFKFERNPNTGDPLPIKVQEDDIFSLKEILEFITALDIATNLPLTKELFRCLVYCASGQKVVQIAPSFNLILLGTHKVFLQLVTIESDKFVTLKTLLNFLINISVGCPNTGRKVWGLFRDDLLDMLKNRLLIDKAAALIYNILCKNSDIDFSFNFIQEILNIVELEDSSEYVNATYILFLLEYIIRNYSLEHHKSLKTEHRIIILTELKANNKLLSKRYILVLIDDFKKKSDCILKTVKDYVDQISPVEVSILLDILTKASSNEDYLKIMQQDRSLLINCAFLLKSIQSAGKEGENNFTAISKLSMLKDEEISKHPAYGFKASLIRLLGNLGWKSSKNQDELRELDCIPLLLDCCNMDARNPFIIQCVVLAIRNLCEKNPLNQQVIASLTKQGVIDSATLNELGLTMHTDGKNEIKIAPLVFPK